MSESRNICGYMSTGGGIQVLPVIDFHQKSQQSARLDTSRSSDLMGIVESGGYDNRRTHASPYCDISMKCFGHRCRQL